MLGILTIIGVPTVLGLFILSILVQKQASQFNLSEKLALSFGLGLGAIVLIIFGLGIKGFPITLINILLSIAAIIFACLIYIIHTKTFIITKKDLKLAAPNLTALEWLLFGLITLKVLFVLFAALIKPMIDVDAFQFYSIVAKGIFFDKTFTLPYLQQFIGDKPLLPFLAQGWALLAMESANDIYLKLIPAVMFMCLLVIFYSALQRYFNRTYSLLFTWLLSTLPFIIYHAATAYADLTVAFYYSVGTLYLFWAIKKINLPALFLSSCFLGLAVWAKKAGLVMAGIDYFIFMIFLLSSRVKVTREQFIKICTALLLFILIISPWLILGRFGSLTNVARSVAISAPQPAGEQGKLGIIINMFLKKLFLYGDWQLLWLMFVLTLVFYFRKAFSRPYVYLLLIILLDLLSLFVQFGSGETFRWLMDGTLLDRLVMPIIPVVMLFCAEVLIPGLKDKKKES